MIPSDARIKELTPLVRHIAWKVYLTLPTSFIGRDDLEQIGMIGLLDAFRLYKPTPGSTFLTYASLRIRGAIMDELRGHDPLSRAARRNLNAIKHTSAKLLRENGKRPTATEVANSLKIGLKKYHHVLAEECALNPDALALNHGETEDGFYSAVHDTKIPGPYEALATKRKFLAILERIEKLPTREKAMIRLYYGEGETLLSIGKEYGLTESRVSQIMQAAIGRLKAALVGWK